MPSIQIKKRSGKTYRFTKFPIFIGRNKSCEVPVGGRGVSRQHAQIIYDVHSDLFEVNDLKSLNGVQVNGQRVESAVLESGDLVSVVGVELVFHRLDGMYHTKAKRLSSSISQLSEHDIDDIPFDQVGHVVDRADQYGTGDYSSYLDAPNEGVTQQPVMSIVLGIIAILLLITVCFFAYKIFQDEPPNTYYEEEEMVNYEEEVVNYEEVGEAASEHQSPQLETEINEIEVVNRIEPLNTQKISVAVPQVDKGPMPLKAATEFTQMPLPTGDMLSQDRASGKVVPTPVNESDELFEKGLNALADVNENTKQLLVTALSEYRNGNGKAVLSELKDVQQQAHLLSDSLKVKLEETISLIDSLVAQFYEGLGAYRLGEKNRAFKLWTIFMRSERELIGDNETHFAKEVNRMVIAEYLARANSAIAEARYHDAYHLWKKAANLDESGVAKQSILNAEVKAQSLYDEGLQHELQGMDDQAKKAWNRVIQLLPPEHTLHKKALGKMTWYDR